MQTVDWSLLKNIAVACGVCLPWSAVEAEISKEKIQQSTDVQGCSQHGPGYVRLEGTEACARIGSRMRVEMNVTHAPAFLGGATLFGAPAPFDAYPADGPSRAYLRLEQPGPSSDRQISR